MSKVHARYYLMTWSARFAATITAPLFAAYVFCNRRKLRNPYEGF